PVPITARQKARPWSAAWSNSCSGTSLPRCTPCRSEYVTRTLLTAFGSTPVAVMVFCCSSMKSLRVLAGRCRVARGRLAEPGLGRRLELQGLVERRDAVVLCGVRGGRLDALGTTDPQVREPQHDDAERDEREDDPAVGGILRPRVERALVGEDRGGEAHQHDGDPPPELGAVGELPDQPQRHHGEDDVDE